MAQYTLLDVVQKQCRYCHEIKPNNEFVKSKSGKHGTLNKCKACKRQEWHDLDDEYKKNKHKQYAQDIQQSVDLRLKYVHNVARTRAKKKGYTFNISASDLINLWDKQKGICAISKRNLSLETHSKDIVSLDRIDNSIGYQADNIQLVSSTVNIMKGTLNMKELVGYCKDILGGIDG